VLQAGSTTTSGRFLPRPSMASTSILPTKGRPTSPVVAELTYYQELFAIPTTAPTTTTWTTSPSDRLGYMTEPSALASAIYVVIDANAGTKHPPPGTSQRRVQWPCHKPTDYRGSATPPLPYATNSGAPGEPP
jgi:hypothetical protein